MKSDSTLLSPGERGTPTFCVTGARYDDSYDIESSLRALEQAAS